ncbi:hypothetical protein [Vibrio owensii]|uniref:Uncharacterized protein n=1 Tax=Vibrio owensii CAIM 1854 = LMG 25443 TaxID=1229493 RepID=A0A0C1WCL9_9VIBR|nr:hypothetical protein [Vibrio owensii]KIF54087.1 hypothetical protein H735_06775 [Vibrio owensii CAIM 1854 = LMG 25443]
MPETIEQYYDDKKKASIDHPGFRMSFETMKKKFEEANITPDMIGNKKWQFCLARKNVRTRVTDHGPYRNNNCRFVPNVINQLERNSFLDIENNEHFYEGVSWLEENDYDLTQINFYHWEQGLLITKEEREATLEEQRLEQERELKKQSRIDKLNQQTIKLYNLYTDRLEEWKLGDYYSDVEERKIVTGLVKWLYRPTFGWKRNRRKTPLGEPSARILELMSRAIPIDS